MGKANIIQNQCNTNKAFEDYTMKMNQDMETHCQEMNSKIASMIETHYRYFNDSVALIEAQYLRLDTAIDWSLDKVNAIISACSEALFGGPGDGKVQKKEVSDDVNRALEAIKNMELYIANAAFDIIQDIVGSFTGKTSTTVELKYAAQPVAPGMTLFLAVANNSYSHDEYMKNEKIVQTMYIFKVYYSIEERNRLVQLDDWEMYFNQKQAFYTQIKKINDVIAALDVTADDYLEKITKQVAIIDIFNKRVTALDDIIHKLYISTY